MEPRTQPISSNRLIINRSNYSFRISSVHSRTEVYVIIFLTRWTFSISALFSGSGFRRNMFLNWNIGNMVVLGGENFLNVVNKLCLWCGYKNNLLCLKSSQLGIYLWFGLNNENYRFGFEYKNIFGFGKFSRRQAPWDTFVMNIFGVRLHHTWQIFFFWNW